MSCIAIVCSGQGAQAAGMFDLFAEVPESNAVFESARRVLGGADPRELVREEMLGNTATHTATNTANPPTAHGADLYSNKTGQILCTTLAMAAWHVIEPWVVGPRLVAGYSIGELGAWGVAGIFSADQVLDLAAKRASAMDAATLEPSGLLAVRGLRRPALEVICHDAGTYIAIVNDVDQMLVGGTLKALAIAEDKAKAAGAQRTTMLPVAVASHTPLLATASSTFRSDLNAIPYAPKLPPGVRLLSGIDGDSIYDVAAGVDKLALQIQQTVDWAACMESMRAAGASKMLELGPGSALTRMLNAYLPECDARSVAEFRSLAGIEAWLRRE